ncbi:hypothetical protein [Bacillus salipaludis]|uniref:DUF4025 domain-containing protein n=1 Tax=Bacillus salipaludis TaxID=2547811 RepID=A0ABW8RGM5_9BACI
MKRDRIDQNHEEFNVDFKENLTEDKLEISSTGYGLESVSKETQDGLNLIDSKKNPSDAVDL